MLTAETGFDDAVGRFSGNPRVTAGTGFGASPGRRVDGRIFAMLVQDQLVVTLRKERVAELVQAGVAGARRRGLRIRGFDRTDAPGSHTAGTALMPRERLQSRAWQQGWGRAPR